MASPSHRTVALVLLAATVLAVATQADARRLPRPPRRPAPIYEGPSHHSDQSSAASSHGHHGRVQIKVYRGPDHEHHAPHGYWVKQPADDPPHHR